MDIRYSCNQRDFKRYTTEEVRNEFLITDLYKADEMVAVYSHVDRMVTLGCMPVNEVVSIDKGIDIWANFGTHYFLERRESWQVFSTLGWMNWLMVRLLQVSRVPSGRLAASARVISLVS